MTTDKVVTTDEDVVDDGQKITHSGTTRIIVQLPIGASSTTYFVVSAPR